MNQISICCCRSQILHRVSNDFTNTSVICRLLICCVQYKTNLGTDNREW
jgi:hypothetical protein